MLKRYRYRAYPTKDQQESMTRVFGCVRVVFNDFIASRRKQHEAGEDFESASILQTRLITQAKRTVEREWLSEVSSTPLQQSLRDADQAYRNFFNSCKGKRKGPKMGAPRFKKRSQRQAARFTKQARFSVHRTTHGVGFVRLPKIGRVRFNLSRPLPSEPSSVTLIKETDGRYYVSFVVDEKPPAPLPETDRVSGVDVGLTHLATIASSDGTSTKIDNPRWMRTRAVKLARAQRALSRRKDGSKNRAKAARKVAAEHRKIRQTRADFHHKLALDLVRENQAIAVESISAKALARTRLGKSVLDAAWATLIRLIKEKAEQHGRTVVVIDRWEPTSQTCSACGTKDGPKPLSVREWTCPTCGTRLDRDINAAINIMLAAGLAERENACGDSVRRRATGAESTKQEPTEQAKAA